MLPAPIPHPVPIVPRSAYHAARLALEGKGDLKVIGSVMYFTDRNSRVVSANWRYASNTEAKLQMAFFHQSAQDHKTNCAYLRLIKGGKA